MSIRIGIGKVLLPESSDVGSPYLSETLAYQARVEADGGLINDIAQTDLDIRMLKDLSLFDTFDRIYLPYGGMKLRESAPQYFIEKWYDVKGATGDASQAVAGSQPEYAGSQLNGIDVINSVDDEMDIAAITPLTIIAVHTTSNSSSAGLLGGLGGGIYFAPYNLGARYRDVLGDSAAWALAADAIRIDSILISGGLANIYRKKIVSATGALAKTASQFELIFRRDGGNFFVGQVGIILLSTTAISVADKESIEDYYISLFNIT